jgi:aminoglycoside 6'-N-acetyltransferase
MFRAYRGNVSRMKAPLLRGDRLELRPLVEGDLDALHRIVSTPEVARWWNPHTRESVEKWLSEDDAIRWTMWVGRERVGKIQAYEQNEPEFRYAGIDLFLAPEHHGRGLGRESVHLVARWLIEERGHHRLIIDPALTNEPAIRCYESVGFKRVGVMRRYWLDRTQGAWVDGLLLDLLADELVSPARDPVRS